MKNFDLSACGAKIELALKTFRTTLSSVDQQWADAARRDFEENHLSALEPQVKNLQEALARLAGVLASAERQCGSDRD